VTPRPAGRAEVGQLLALELSVFTRAGDRYGGRPLHEEIIERARAAGLDSAIAFRGLQGFGASACLHSAGLTRLGPGVPVRVDIVAAAARVRAFLRSLDVVVSSGLVTIRPVAGVQVPAANPATADLSPASPPRVFWRRSRDEARVTPGS
jgi:uncharacterized protein